MLWYFIILIASFYAYHRIRYRRKYELAATFPGPFDLPIIGNAYFMLYHKSEDLIRLFTRMRYRYGGIARFWVGLKLYFLVSDARLAEVVLSSSTKHLAKNDLYGFLRPWLGDGLLLSRDEKWHIRRKILTPAFHFKILGQFVQIFDKQSCVLVERLRRHAQAKDVFDVHRYVALMALDIICETAMGTEINAQTNASSSYVRAVHGISKILAIRFAKMWQRNDFLYKVLSSKAKHNQDKAIRVLHDFTKAVIKSRREQLLNEVQSDDVPREDGTRWKMPLLDVLLKSSVNGVPLSDDAVKEEVNTFMFAGHDTSSAAISYTMWLLSRHPDVQTKLYAEVQQVCGTDPNSFVDYSQLQELKYMELVIKESMRLYPPVPIIGRKIEEETKLNDRYTIPANSNLAISLLLIFRDANIFTDPDTFRPERFIDDQTIIESSNAYAYIPFSAGSRNCIGQKFAMLEMKSTLSKVLQHFELVPAGEAPILLMEVILRSSNGVQLGIRPRSN